MLGRSLFYSSISNSGKAEVTKTMHNLKFLLQEPVLLDIKTKTFSLNHCSPDETLYTVALTQEMCDDNVITKWWLVAKCRIHTCITNSEVTNVITMYLHYEHYWLLSQRIDFWNLLFSRGYYNFSRCYLCSDHPKFTDSMECSTSDASWGISWKYK